MTKHINPKRIAAAIIQGLKIIIPINKNGSEHMTIEMRSASNKKLFNFPKKFFILPLYALIICAAS